MTKIPEMPLAGAYFGRDGEPLTLGGLLLRAINALRDRTGGMLGQAFGPLESYTVAQLLAGTPDPAAYPRHLVYVSDGTSNKRLAVSDGAAWRFPDGNVVS